MNLAGKYHHHYHKTQIRTFINARVKWVRDPHLDTAVSHEKNLKPLHNLKTLITNPQNPSKTLPLSFLSPLKPHLHLPTSLITFIKSYPYIFKSFLPPNIPNPQPHVKLTPKALSLHNDELLLLGTSRYRRDVAERLCKVLMLSGVGKMPLFLIEMLKFDLGLMDDYLLGLVLEFPEFFRVCDMGFRGKDGRVVFGLEVVSWREDLAVSVMENRRRGNGNGGGVSVRYTMNLPRGFDLEKRVLEWVEDVWQGLPYISPYENVSHLGPNCDYVEKWVVGVVHELLSLLVSKKTERENVFCLGEFWGVDRVRMKRALVRFPGIFYVSNKIRTQTVVLREAYEKGVLVEKHPLMVMRGRYVRLMNLVLRRGKPIRNGSFRDRKRLAALSRRGRNMKKDDGNRIKRSDDDDD